MIFLLSGRPSWLRRASTSASATCKTAISDQFGKKMTFSAATPFRWLYSSSNEIVETLSTLCSPLTFERRRQLCHFAAFAFSGKAQLPTWRPLRNPEYAARVRAEVRQQAHSRRAKQRWHYADNAIRLPATLRHQWKETADGKLPRCNRAFQSARLFWHVQRAAPHHGGPSSVLYRQADSSRPPATAGGRRRGNDPHHDLVPPAIPPSRRCICRCRLPRRVVNAVDQYFHNPGTPARFSARK